MRILTRIFALSALILSLLSCKKDKLITDGAAKLAFSQDSVLFDTVFTTIGSTTKRFKIYNRHKQPIKISEIWLAGGTSSNFRINIDGIAGISHKDVEIPAEDSLFAFVEVTVDPNNSNSPLVIRDSVMFETNGNLQRVLLEAWGQDAYYHVPNVFPTNGFPAYSIVAAENQAVIWPNDKPHVVYGYAVVDSAGSLTIQEGTRIHFHKNSGMWVYRFGTLKVMGTPNNWVTFQGDRLEQAYKDIPGQWDRIWLNQGSVDNEIHYAEIRNGFIGIQAERFLVLDGTNKLVMDHVKVHHMSGIGIYTINYNINASDLLVYDCGQHMLAITAGGDYRFDHCTFANYWTFETRNTASVLISNRDASGNELPLVNAEFNNCIVYGSLGEELELDSINLPFDYKFSHCLLKTAMSTSNAYHYNMMKVNEDPKFNDIPNQDYHLDSGSPAANFGNTAIGGLHPFDLDNEARDPFAPDLGCYEDF
jgi:hypothetical protein